MARYNDNHLSITGHIRIRISQDFSTMLKYSIIETDLIERGTATLQADFVLTTLVTQGLKAIITTTIGHVKDIFYSLGIQKEVKDEGSLQTSRARQYKTTRETLYY